MQPFTKSQISKVNKTLAERNEVQLILTDTSHFLHSMLDHTKTGDTIGTMSFFNWKECGYLKPSNSHDPISTQ